LRHHASVVLRLMVEGSPGGTSRKPVATGAESWASLVPKARRERWPRLRRGGDTWLRQTCKGAPYEAETRSAACKGGLAVRRHAGGLYDAGSYCYALVKRVKPFVRNGKGVIEALCNRRTHINEKRAPKASVCFLAFGFLSVSFLLRNRSCRGRSS
jgi:hypothetical protein